jgi:hypothetical protein
LAGWFDRIFGGRSRALTLARSAELRGDLARAALLFARAGRLDEASRVRRTRALSVLETSRDTPMSPGVARQLAMAAADLEATGEYGRAAEAYARLRDVEAQGRALAHAGEVDSLDVLLGAERERACQVLSRREGHDLFDMRVASGQRREAAAFARVSADGALRARGRELEATRVASAAVPMTIRGRQIVLVLGDQVVLGRAPLREQAEVQPPAEGSIVVESAAVSRRHLLFARARGEVVLRDLGSHNGTTLAGRSLQGEVTLGDGLDLRLGGEVPLIARRADDLPGFVAIEVTGVRYVAPLGPALLAVGRWRLEPAPPGDVGAWVDLVTEDDPPAFAAGIRLVSRVSLLKGDTLSTERNGDALVVMGS